MAASGQSNVVDFPSELQDRLTVFDDALSQIESIVKPLHGIPLSQIHAEISSLDKAKLDLIGAYAVNSLFWMYLNVRGVNPKEHGVKQELERIRSYMTRVKEIQDKEKAPSVNQDATKRFVRSALWQNAHKEAKERKARQEGAQASTSTSPAEGSSSTPQRQASKRRSDEAPDAAADTNKSKGKRKKKKKH